jgi:hypothetical protein
VLGRNERSGDPLAGAKVDLFYPALAHDLAQEILDHAPMGEEKPIAEVVLSHNFPSGL